MALRQESLSSRQIGWVARVSHVPEFSRSKVRQTNELFLPNLTPKRSDFFANDVIFLGDLPAQRIQGAERFCEMTKEFVSKFAVVGRDRWPRFGPGQLTNTRWPKCCPSRRTHSKSNRAVTASSICD